MLLAKEVDVDALSPFAAGINIVVEIGAASIVRATVAETMEGSTLAHLSILEHMVQHVVGSFGCLLPDL